MSLKRAKGTQLIKNALFSPFTIWNNLFWALKNHFQWVWNPIFFISDVNFNSTYRDKSEMISKLNTFVAEKIKSPLQEISEGKIWRRVTDVTFLTKPRGDGPQIRAPQRSKSRIYCQKSTVLGHFERSSNYSFLTINSEKLKKIHNIISPTTILSIYVLHVYICIICIRYKTDAGFTT